MEIIRSLLQRRKREPRSSYEVIGQLLPKKFLEQILLETPDRREIPSEASKVLGRTEEELMRDVAVRLRLPYLRSLSEIPFHYKSELPDIELLIRAACIPIVERGAITNLASPDPAMAIALLGAYKQIGTLPPVIVSWNEVKRALRCTEVLWRDEQSKHEAKVKEARDNAATALCFEILDEAKRYGENTVVATLTQENGSYRIRSTEGKTATGEISKQGASLLTYALKQGYLGVTRGEDRLVVKSIISDLDIQVTLSLVKIIEDRRVSLKLVTNGPAPKTEYSVLLIEDNEAFSRVLLRFLEGRGFSIQVLKDGQSAWNTVSQAVLLPKVVIADLHISGLSGIELISKISNLYPQGEIKLILLTSDESSEVELQGLAAGADAVLKKSADPRLLEMHLRRIFTRAA